MAYLAMARGNEKDAATRFDRALQADSGYVPALIGRGQVMLELDRDADALASFEAALAKDPSLTELRSRVDVLKFRATQDMLARAKAAADARRWDEAASIYRQAIAASPDSGFLYRDLAAVEQRAGQSANALEHYRKAVEIDPGDARSHAGIGAILESQGDVLGALAEYERARAIDPSEAPENAINRLRAAAALAKLPAEYRAIPSNASVTRAEIAALVGIKLEAAPGAGAAAAGHHHRYPRALGAAVDRARRPIGRDGYAAELRVRGEPAGQARRARDHGVTPAHA